jgi:hypothetical protein
MRGESPFGRRHTVEGWVELGTRFERFESQPPTDDYGDHARLKFKERQALRLVQGAIDNLSEAPRGTGRRTGLALPTLNQRRYEKWWRGRVAEILEDSGGRTVGAGSTAHGPDGAMRRAA